MTGRVLLDCDGVLLDYTSGFRDYLRREFGLFLDPEGPDGFDMTGWTGLPRDKLISSIKAFNGGEGTGFDALSPTPNAVAAVRDMAAAGLDLRVLTSCSDDPAPMRARERNLENVFGPVFQEVDFLPLGTPKGDILSRHPPAEWVEDHVGNAIAGLEAGHRPHIIRRSHNRAEEREGGIPQAVSWHDCLGSFHLSISASLDGEPTFSPD